VSHPWMKFYPSDWRADPALRMCSLGARGLWAEMMCIMHEAEPYGHLLVNGRVMTVKEIASLTGGSTREVDRLLAELDRSGVFSRTERGVIYSRRMKRDQEKAERDKANGGRGGNPKITTGVNPPVNPSDNGEDKAQKPEAIVQNVEKKEDCPKRVRTAYSDEFENKFWKPYPKTPIMSKKEAFREWQKLTPEKQLEACQAIPGFVVFLKANPTHAVVHACRFLSQGRGEGFAPEAPSEKVAADMAARGWEWRDGRWQKREAA
jgi:hypothetical protein